MEKIIEKYLNPDVKNVGGSTLRQVIEAAFLSLYAVTARPSQILLAPLKQIAVRTCPRKIQN